MVSDVYLYFDLASLLMTKFNPPKISLSGRSNPGASPLRNSPGSRMQSYQFYQELRTEAFEDFSHRTQSLSCLSPTLKGPLLLNSMFCEFSSC